MIGYIYKFTNPLNHKVYIGQTVNLHRRFTKHRYDTPKCHTKFGKAIKKYGIDYFKFEILFRIPSDNKEKLSVILNILETSMISKYNSYENGYNSTLGGSSGSRINSTPSLEVREKIRNSLKIHYSNHDNLRIRRKEQLNLIRPKHKIISVEQREKISKALIGRKLSKDTKYKISVSNKGKNGNSLEFLQEIRNKASRVNSKPVIQYSVDNCFIREFKSSTEAANILNLNPRLIGKCCRGVIKTSGGFIWKFKTI